MENLTTFNIVKRLNTSQLSSFTGSVEIEQKLKKWKWFSVQQMVDRQEPNKRE